MVRRTAEEAEHVSDICRATCPTHIELQICHIKKECDLNGHTSMYLFVSPSY